MVLAAGLRFLETRSRAIEEVRRRLTQSGYRSELVEGAIERLTRIGLLDDDLFAQAWVESRDRAHPRGEAALRRELGLRGVPREVIGGVLDRRREDPGAPGELDNDEPAGSPDEAAARRLIERRRRDLERIDDPRRRRERAYALLARHGFDPEVCRVVAGSVASPAARP